MLKKISLSLGAIAMLYSSANAAYNSQAEKDRLALIKYMEAKFADPVKNKDRFFPYSTDEEVKNNIKKGVKWQDFAKGTYSYYIQGREQYDEIMEMPPFEDNIDAGEEAYNNSKALKKCFPNPAEARVEYPKYDDKSHQVITLTQAINDCLINYGEKKLNPKKGKLADIEAYFAAKAAEEEKTINVKINSAEAAAAYERGKKYYYSQRGYLKLSCANCHVQGAGKRVRREYLSPLLGATTHFPVYRLKWNGLGTIERRLSGCIKDTGQQPPKPTSQDMKELIFFMYYMSNGMKFDGPDVRK